MKRNMIGGITMLYLLITVSITYATRINLDFSDNKWINPISGDMQTDTNYNYLSTDYETNWSRQHVGDDIIAKLDSPVYAIADGRVGRIDRKADIINSKGQIENYSHIYIIHETSNRIKFTAVYGHCKAVSTLNVDDYVVAGERIGFIKKCGSPVHLHFGINQTDNLLTDSTNGWGRISTLSNDYQLGWRSPSNFLDRHTPLLYRWEGTGSIISEGTKDISCWGCDKDELRIHPGSDMKSMLTFQWQASKRCKALEISCNSNVNNRVNIRIGGWSSRNYDRVYSNITLPFVLDASNTGFSLENGIYYTIRVCFDKVVNKMTKVYARCTEKSGSIKKQIVRQTGINYDGLILQFGDFTSWNGNASIISEDSKSYECWGCNKDEARVHPTVNNIQPEVYFQWQGSDRCRTLKISSGPNPNSQGENPSVEIFVKPWYLDEEQCQSSFYGGCGLFNTKLPYTLKDNYAPNNGSYNVVRVRFLNGVSSKKSIIAQCPDAW